jgi:MFS family permease
MRYLPRFFGQPRLRLAWALAVGRLGWWQLFYIYGPIYAVSNSFSDVEGGAVVSVGSAMLFLVRLWGWLGRRYGLCSLLVASYGFAGILTMAVAAMSDMPWLGIALIVGAALGASGVDGGGNVAFLRAVRPLERAEMTTVYMTYRNASQLGPPGIYAFLLRSFELPAVFIAGGAMTLAMAWLSRYIPRRM